MNSNKLKNIVKECIVEVLTESNEPIIITPTEQEDDWSRPIYKGQDDRIYVDVNCGKGNPSIHSVTDEGEPNFPIKNFTINKSSTSSKEHRNALCPRCKNSKPELMKITPDGKMSCNYCHWEDNPSEPYVHEGFDPQSQGPNPSNIENPYPAWNNKMRQMEEAKSKNNRLTPKAILVIQKWCTKGHREAAMKLVDFWLNRKLGLSSADLSDTTTFSEGLDMIEAALDNNNYQSAFIIAKDTADEMITDEGGID